MGGNNAKSPLDRSILDARFQVPDRHLSFLMTHWSKMVEIASTVDEKFPTPYQEWIDKKLIDSLYVCRNGNIHTRAGRCRGGGVQNPKNIRLCQVMTVLAELKMKTVLFAWMDHSNYLLTSWRTVHEHKDISVLKEGGVKAAETSTEMLHLLSSGDILDLQAALDFFRKDDSRICARRNKQEEYLDHLIIFLLSAFEATVEPTEWAWRFYEREAVLANDGDVKHFVHTRSVYEHRRKTRRPDEAKTSVAVINPARRDGAAEHNQLRIID